MFLVISYRNALTEVFGRMWLARGLGHRNPCNCGDFSNTLLPRFFRHPRNAFLLLLEHIPLSSTSQDQSLEKAIALILAHQNARSDWISVQPAIQRQDSLTPRFGNGADVARDPPAAVHCVD